MEELIERLKRYSEQCIAERLDPDFAAAIIEAINVLSLCQMLGAKPEPQWISVEDRLPALGEKVAIYYKDVILGARVGLDCMVISNTTDTPYWYAYTGRVLAWMPLPEPPKEET